MFYHWVIWQYMTFVRTQDILQYNYLTYDIYWIARDQKGVIL